MRKMMPEPRNRNNGSRQGREMKIIFCAIYHLRVDVNSSFDSFQPCLTITDHNHLKVLQS